MAFVNIDNRYSSALAMVAGVILTLTRPVLSISRLDSPTMITLPFCPDSSANKRSHPGKPVPAPDPPVNLAEYALFFGEPGMNNARYERLARFSAADVQRVASQYLTVENRTVVVTRPKPATANQGGQ